MTATRDRACLLRLIINTWKYFGPLRLLLAIFARLTNCTLHDASQQERRASSGVTCGARRNAKTRCAISTSESELVRCVNSQRNRYRASMRPHCAARIDVTIPNKHRVETTRNKKRECVMPGR
jgi:hypothetical protein